MIQRMLLAIDAITTWVGHAISWLLLLMAFVIGYEVFARYVMRAPTTWAYDVSYILYGTAFMLAGAYALSRGAHVRGDFIYRRFSPTHQASLDLVLYFLFFFPGILALVYSGWGFFKLSYDMNEHSAFSPAGPVIWPFKAVIPVTGVLLLLQGIAETIRCVICIRDGQWPRRLHDVEETDVVILQQVEGSAAR